MRILIISRNAWDDTNSIGNTLSNFFGNLKDVELANIYFRPSSPCNTACKLYFRVTEMDILKHWLFPGNIGKSFRQEFKDVSCSEKTVSDHKKEKSIISFIHKNDFKLAYKISDWLWNSERWMNENLDSFITSFNPDVVFSFVKAAPQYFLTIWYLREKFQIPLFTWIADDEYTGYLQEGSSECIQRLRYIIGQSSVVCGCSKQICDYYNAVFGCEATPMYKGCTFSDVKEKSATLPVQFIYAGNLLYGRLDVIRSVAESIEKIDGGRNRIIFEIYSNTALSEDERGYFDSLKCTSYLGKRSYESIKKRMESADIVLHAESFEKEQIIKTKYSFSTKLIDCMQSGSVMLAIGPGELASIDYVKHIPGAYVIDDYNCIHNGIAGIMLDRDTFYDRARMIRLFAERYHNSATNGRAILELLDNIVRREA